MTPIFKKPKPPSRKPAGSPAPATPRPPKGLDDGMEGKRNKRQPKPTPTKPPERTARFIRKP